MDPGMGAGALEMEEVDRGEGPGLVRLDSPLSSPGNARRLARALAEAGASGAAGIVLDLRCLSSDPDTLDAFAMAERLAREASGRRLRVALVADEVATAGARFMETVLVNRGAMACVFPSDGAAAAWLRADSPRAPESLTGPHCGHGTIIPGGGRELD